jgi:hypothetical protein
MAQVTVPSSGSYKTKRVYYTNKAIAGTAINEQVKVGYVMCFDHTNAAPGETANRGRCVNKPETGNLMLFAGIVTSVAGLPTTSGGVKNGDAGWIEIAVGDAVETYTHANMTKDTTQLMTANGDWALIASTGIGSIAVINQHVGTALETANTSSTLANKFVAIKGPGVTFW